MTRPRYRLIDSLRGLMLVLMTVVHLPGATGAIFDEPLGFIGTSEGFIFISALLVGLLARDGRLDMGWRYYFRRAALLYIFHFATFVLLLLTVLAVPSLHHYWREFGLTSDLPLLRTVCSGALLMFQPRYLDILPLFIGFLIICPFLLSVIAKKQVHLLLIFSALLWLLGTHYDLPQPFHAVFLQLGLLNASQSPFYFISWQLLFILGLSIGYHHSSIEKLFQSTGVRRATTFVSLTVVLCCLLWRHGIVAHPLSAASFAVLVGKPKLGVIRIVELIALVYLIRLLCLNLRISLPSALGFLGRHSLSVYSFHVIILYALAPWRRIWHESWPLSIQLVCTAITVGLLFIPAYINSVMRFRAQQKGARSIPSTVQLGRWRNA